MSMRDSQTEETGTHAGPPAQSMVTQGLQAEMRPAGLRQRLGLPPFKWSLTLLGLCVFTFAIVTLRLPVAQAGIVIAVLGLVLQPEKIRLPFPVWLYGAFVLWAFVASFASRYPEMAGEQLIEHLKVWVVMIVALNALQAEGRLRFYLLFFLACFILYPIRGTFANYVVGHQTFGRAIGNYAYSNPNDLAALCLVTLGVAIGFASSASSWTLVRIGAGLSAILLLVVILLTQSRGVFVGLAIGLGPALILSALKRPMLLVPAFAGLLAIGTWIPASVWERLAGLEKVTTISTIAEADPEGSAAQRFEIQKVALRIVVDNPVFGIGLGAYRLENARYAPELGPRDTHNTYLNVAAEVGLPGFVLWCALVWSVLRYAYRSRRQHAAQRQLATEQAWIERAIWGYFVAGLFGNYSALTLPYLLLAVLWSSATLLSTSQPAPQTAARSGSV